MNRYFRFPVYLAITGLLAAGAVAGNAVAASAGTDASCTAHGDFAICSVAGQASHPRTLTVTVTSSPDQGVSVFWNDSCSLGSGSGSTSGSFTGTTPVSRTISHPYTQPDTCIYAAAAQLSNGGTVRVTLSSSTTAAASHEIKGYANLCADDTGNSTALRNKIETWSCYNGASEQWTFSHGELVHRGMCMNDKAGGGSGSPVVLYTCNGAANELWTRNSHGEYVLKARHGTLCLDDPGYSKKNGTQLVVYTCRNTANQHWTLP